MAMPKWDKSKQEMEDAGVTPVTRNWPPQVQNLVLCAWGALDPKTGEVSRKANLKGSEQKIIDAIEEARRGCSRPTERTTSLRAPWEILNTREEHEARALFPGMRAFRNCNIPNFQFGMLYIDHHCISCFIAF